MLRDRCSIDGIETFGTMYSRLDALVGMRITMKAG